MPPCQHCGASNNAASARFCTTCGGKLGTLPGPARTQPVPPPPPSGAPPAVSGVGFAARGVGGGRYVLEGLLGHGGFSAVYRAHDLHFRDRVVAVKEMVDQFADPADRAEAEANFEQEADFLATLHHPLIPQVMDSFSENSRHYLVMEYITGASLDDEMNRRQGVPYPEDQVRAWALDLCSVLAYLHSRQPPVVFRDLKPSNIMLQSDGQVRLIDFGIARLFKPHKTADTSSLGSPGFASPEHYAGQTDERSDLYSLGATLHYLLSSRDPSKHPLFVFPPLRTVNPAVSAEMEELIQRCLTFDRTARYGSVTEVAAALRAPGQAGTPHLAPQHSSPQGLSTVAFTPPSLVLTRQAGRDARASSPYRSLLAALACAAAFLLYIWVTGWPPAQALPFAAGLTLIVLWCVLTLAGERWRLRLTYRHIAPADHQIRRWLIASRVLAYTALGLLAAALVVQGGSTRTVLWSVPLILIGLVTWCGEPLRMFQRTRTLRALKTAVERNGGRVVVQ